MGGIFSLDGPFYRFGTMVWDIMALSLLWIVFSLPIFTIGASTTSLYYITTRRLAKKEGYITRDFWASFSSNFAQATKIWLAIMAIGMVILYNLYVMLYQTEVLGMPQPMLTVIMPLQVLFLIELIMFTFYVFPIISRFNIRGKLLFKTTLLMAHKHLPTTILLIAMFVLIVLSVFLLNQPMIVVFGMGIYAYSASYFLVRIFKKYRPEMDKEEETEMSQPD